MTDYSRDRLGPNDEDRLPWLEPVEEEFEEGPGGPGRLIIWIIAAVVVVALVAGAYFWMRGGNKAAAGGGALIAAPDSYYKERPGEDAPAVGEDEIVYSASKGNEVASVIDTSGTAETPVNIDRPAPAAPPAPAAAPAAPAPAVSKTAPAVSKPTAPAAPVVAAPKPAAAPPVAKAAPKPQAKAKTVVAVAPPEDHAPASGGSTVQLGAFSSPAKASSAWKNLSGRFSFLAGLTQSVVPVQSGDKTLYRLRASGGNAGNICGRLRTAGETCSVVG